MPDIDTLDFERFTAAVVAATKPDYADVQARAARRKRRWGGWGAAAVALVVAGGGTTFARTAGQTPDRVTPAPVPVVQPWHTIVPRDGGREPQPQPSFHEIKPGSWDVVEPDEPLTGIYPLIKGG